ncbi:MAG: helix-turn-helix transcriptional regulator [Oscillospiraceae bacterium]|nr:helix-turn-helix transcriptional regulator [Oscillospiraceae bacterium]
MAKNFRETLNKQLKNPEFKKEYDSLQPEFQIIRALFDGRKEKNITQKQLSEITGINQADISKIEKGSANPSVRTLQRLAAGMDMNVRIEFVPNQNPV